MKFIRKQVLKEAVEEINTEVIEKDTQEQTTEDPIDTIRVTVPLFLRLMEYAKEDAKTDMDLHFVTEHLQELLKDKPDEALDMDEYDTIIPKQDENDKDKEEVKESVQTLTESIVEKIPDNTRRFDVEEVVQAIERTLNLNDREMSVVEKWFNGLYEELTAEEVDKYLFQIQSELHILPIDMEEVENKIMMTKDPVTVRYMEFKADVANDKDVIRTAIDNVVTIAADQRLSKIISELDDLDYGGEQNIGWRKEDAPYGEHPKEQIIA